MLPSGVWMSYPSFFESARWYFSLIWNSPTSRGFTFPRNTVPSSEYCLNCDSQREILIITGTSLNSASTSSRGVLGFSGSILELSGSSSVGEGDSAFDAAAVGRRKYSPISTSATKVILIILSKISLNY